MTVACHATCSFYLFGLVLMILIPWVHVAPRADPVRPIDRALAHGEISAGVPRLDAEDPHANAAILTVALAEVGRAAPCEARPRFFTIRLGPAQRLSRVRFGARPVCQLQRIKEISMAQASPQDPSHGMGEVAAFILGRRIPGGSDVDVTRVVVPPFRFSGESVSFPPSDLGPLLSDEQLIGTYHTHPEGDVEEGVPSEVDLRFMETGYIDFHGQVGWLKRPRDGLDWLFDIVEPRDGDWNIYAHDHPRLSALLHLCQKRRASSGSLCPVDELRISGSPYYLLTRFYEEPAAGLVF